MPPRGVGQGSFVLVYTIDPPSADVFKKTEVIGGGGPFEIGQTVRVRRPSWHECEGIIVSIGTKKDLLALKVQEGGTLTTDCSLALQNRFQDLLKKKKEAGLSARDQTLQNIAVELVNAGGPGNLHVAAGVRNTLRLPKRRPHAIIDQLQIAVDTLECFTAPPADQMKYYTALGGEPVWLRTSTILVEQALHPHHPPSLLLRLLKRLVPMNILVNPALSLTGSRDTVRLPDKILAAINMAVLSFCDQRKIAVNCNVVQIVRNFLYNASHPDRKRARLDGQLSGAEAHNELEAETGQTNTAEAEENGEAVGAGSANATEEAAREAEGTTAEARAATARAAEIATAEARTAEATAADATTAEATTAEARTAEARAATARAAEIGTAEARTATSRAAEIGTAEARTLDMVVEAGSKDNDASFLRNDESLADIDLADEGVQNSGRWPLPPRALQVNNDGAGLYPVVGRGPATNLTTLVELFTAEANFTY